MHSSSSHTQTERSRTSSPPPAPSVRLSVHTFPVVRLLPPVITRCRPSQDKDHRVHIKGRGRITHFLTKWPEPPQPYSPLPPLLALLSPLTTRTSAAGMLSMSRRWGSEVFVLFSSSFYLGCDTITGKTGLKFWQRQDYGSALEYNFFWDVEHRSEMSECVAVRISLTETRERHRQSNLWEIVGKSWDPGGIRGFRQNFHQPQYNSQTRPSVWRK